MAIRVICPGCMTSFEVDDKFAGKKGPCPKCGHIIEIPKEQVVVHAPDDYTKGGKKQKILGHDARPIERKLLRITGKQAALGCVVLIAAFALAYLVGLAHNGILSAILGLLGAALIAFPIAEFGYMMIRDENDLEMFLGAERHKRSLFAALVFVASWIAFEIFLYFLGGTGPLACLFLIPVGVVGAFGALIFFDCNFGRALLVYLIFAFVAIIGRGLIITDHWTPNGWIWQEKQQSLVKNDKPAEKRPQAAETPAKPETSPSAAPKPQQDKPAITREAPKVDPTKRRR
ncbi:MAG: hypothetical protein IJU03_09705 [Thermoguttaceae bacterium]|nr:hypothetical protein [Thermoguttaceae bacterium]